MQLGVRADDDPAGATGAAPEARPSGAGEFTGLFEALLGSKPARPEPDEQGWLPALSAPSEGLQSSRLPLEGAVALDTIGPAPGERLTPRGPLPLQRHKARAAEESQSPLPADRLRAFPAVPPALAAGIPENPAGLPASTKQPAEGLLAASSANAPAEQLAQANAREALASRPELPLDGFEEPPTATARAGPEAKPGDDELRPRKETASARELHRSAGTSETRPGIAVAPEPEPAQPTPTPNVAADSTAVRTAPVADSVRPAAGLPELHRQAGPRDLAPTGAERTTDRDGTGTPHAIVPIAPARALLRGEPVFAVRILPPETASVRNGRAEGVKATPDADVHVAMKAEPVLIEEPAAESRPLPAARAASGVEARAVLTRRHTEAFESAPERISEPYAQRGDVRPPVVAAVSRPVSPEVPSEATPPEVSPSRSPASQPEAAPPQDANVRRITLELEGASGARVRLDVRDRAGEIHVAVSARGTAVAALREGAAQLVNGLQARGLAAELIGAPAAAGTPGPAEGSAREQTSPDSAPLPSGWEHGSGGDPGGRRRQAEQPREEFQD
ncbi:MAG TPA: hypothetical protein VNJ11_17545 [Bryobacteraceae bacterium]|nr:hypothetical protein [Bryobacteraceae bacterium]